MRTTVVATLAAAIALAPGSAFAQQRNASPPPPQRIVPNDPNINRPPPAPPERPGVTPQSSAPPMQRIPQVAPLAQPPTR